MIREFWKNNMHGILGTAIFHLALLIVVMLVKIKDINENYEEFILLDFQEEVELPKEKKFNIDLSEIIPELKSRSRSNVAVNEAEEYRKQISTEEYFNELKEKYNVDPEEGWKEKLEEKYSIKDEGSQGEEDFSNPDISPDETNVTYSIENRFARYIHIPVYKCKGSATVMVDIAVNVKGDVTSASVNSSGTNTGDDCFFNEAVSAARRSRFNADYSAPARQKGTITYKFVAQ